MTVTTGFQGVPCQKVFNFPSSASMLLISWQAHVYELLFCLIMIVLGLKFKIVQNDTLK